MSEPESLVERLTACANYIDDMKMRVEALSIFEEGAQKLFREAAAELSTLRSRCETAEANLALRVENPGAERYWEDRARDAEAARDEAVRALEQHKIALNVAVDQLSLYEPGDSRAVSDLFVALAAVACGVNDQDDWTIIDAARATQPAGKEKAE